MKFERKERVIIVGCGRLGGRLATMLSDKGYQVVIIDNDENSFKKLPEGFGGIQIKADGIDLETLKYVDIDDAAMLVACTGNDNMNSLIAQIASRIFGVPNVYVRFEDTDKEKLINGFNIQGIYPFKLTMGIFEEMLSNEDEED
ncbi:MAG: TrkA family potassium uptake protein [Oscillospiraceae bacterium]|nr:TrkA family potassium uptake protein [Candidatus Limimonas coprohippi]MCQ2488559.1 TrkA family potassium uptake protein [Clostridia bacterium]